VLAVVVASGIDRGQKFGVHDATIMSSNRISLLFNSMNLLVVRKKNNT
jgi:hypothetical protein